jgi:hypothetical protein
MKSILDPTFRYTASFNTDLRKTFARIQRERRNDAERAVQATADALANVSSIPRRTATCRWEVSAAPLKVNRRIENA